MPQIVPSRRRFRFSLRTLLAAVTIFGVWLAVQVKWIRDRHDALESLGKEGRGSYAVSTNDKVVHVHFGSLQTPDTLPVGNAPWSLRILGEQGVSWIGFRQEIGVIYRDPERNQEVVDEKVRELKLLFPEAEVVGEPEQLDYWVDPIPSAQ